MTLGTLNPQTDSTLPTLLTRLEPDDSQQLAELCGPFDQHLRQIEQRLGVTISNRGNEFKFVGGEEEIKAAKGAARKALRRTRWRRIDDFRGPSPCLKIPALMP